ncbi:MAG: cytidine deaminase [Campylobacterales bacterium]|nr:cytidine deaminase [Campylobacterales bacterium]
MHYFVILLFLTKKKESSVTPKRLIEEASKVVGEYTLSHPDLKVAKVGAALVTSKGNLYTGVNLELACGIGFCAEHSAIAQMLKHRETRIEMIVALNEHAIIPPCGRCRELMFQINHENLHTKVYIDKNRFMTLRELLPNPWIPNP